MRDHEETGGEQMTTHIATLRNIRAIMRPAPMELTTNQSAVLAFEGHMVR